ncbi:hypothetical protein [Aquabacterium sp. UBA2148]|uniref:hypothetical protein n=1 Tax=Aquabacterium sp. UBA2148 TaxID=1946042 RepID=UPI00257EA99C|nr:hypothetical protein [Aquabacterium sp. UBA2148]
MISYSRPQFWQRTWFTLLCMGVAVAAVVAWWVWQGRSAAAAGGDASTLARGASGVPEAAARAGLQEPTLLSDGRPEDFSAQEWAALKDAMKQSSHPEAELKRVVAYLRFQKRFDQWQGLRDSADVGLRRQVAASLVEQVPERLKEGEVTMGEAQLLLSALWSDLEPDEARRRQRIDEGIKILQAAAPQPDADQARREADRLSEYKRRESAIVLEYQSRPETQRDPAWLEAQLDDARRAVYGGN